MKKLNDNLILAVSSDGRKISVKDCKDFLDAGDKEKLADFIYDRLHGRYLKPFDYPSKDYKKEYKNGFALMASCCLLIETYVSFTEKKYRNTNNKSRECFGHFFTNERRFSDFATGGKKQNGELAGRKDDGIPNDFYENVRCGILHNAEIKNGWTITRDSNKPYFNPATKEINAVKFANRLKNTLKDYRNRLKSADFDNDNVWCNFRCKLNDLIKA